MRVRAGLVRHRLVTRRDVAERVGVLAVLFFVMSEVYRVVRLVTVAVVD